MKTENQVLQDRYGAEIAASLTKYVSKPQAANIVHLLFSRLDSRLAGYDSSKAIRPWLFTCAINDALAVRRASLCDADRQALDAAALIDYRPAAAKLGIPVGSYLVRLRRARRLSAA